jgi:hypothetical protein
MFVFIIVGYFMSVLWPVYKSFEVPPPSDGRQYETIVELIQDADGFEVLKRIAILHHCEEAVMALRAVLDYMDLEDEAVMARRCNEIYEKFVKAGGSSTCNLSGNQVKEIEEKIRRPTSDTFSVLYQEMCKLLKTNFLPEVKKSPDYAELLQKKRADRIGE